MIKQDSTAWRCDKTGLYGGVDSRKVRRGDVIEQDSTAANNFPIFDKNRSNFLFGHLSQEEYFKSQFLSHRGQLQNLIIPPHLQTSKAVDLK